MKRNANVGTYLANDRTLLAWIRTGLALGRTTFSMLSLKAELDGWISLKVLTVNLMAVISSFFLLLGFERFRRLRNNLDENIPPQMVRVGVSPLCKWLHPTGIFDAFFVVAVAMASSSLAVVFQ